MKINVVKKPKTKVIKKTKKKIKNSNQLELIFKENKNNNIKNHNKDLSFNYSNTVNSISRVFLSSFALISFFYNFSFGFFDYFYFHNLYCHNLFNFWQIMAQKILNTLF